MHSVSPSISSAPGKTVHQPIKVLPSILFRVLPFCYFTGQTLRTDQELDFYVCEFIGAKKTTFFPVMLHAGGALCSPRGKVVHSDGAGQVRVYTPSVVSALQEHLGSTDPELGGPLENLVLSGLDQPPLLHSPTRLISVVLQDSSAGRGSSHWESRVLQGSIMTAVLGDPTTVRIDPVTLAALRDTGWYGVNQSRPQSLVWGEGKRQTNKHSHTSADFPRERAESYMFQQVKEPRSGLCPPAETTPPRSSAPAGQILIKNFSFSQKNPLICSFYTFFKNF